MNSQFIPQNIALQVQVEFMDGAEREVIAIYDDDYVWRYADTLEVIQGSILYWDYLEADNA